uniref:Bile acid sodium symporter/ transporter n=1 Tax=Arundo donax TaxID=35708 RepID=A0A0A9HB49_ARUDO
MQIVIAMDSGTSPLATKVT